MSRRRKFSDEDRMKAVTMVVEQHLSKKEVALLYNTDISVIKRWVSYYEFSGIEGIISKPQYYDGNFKVKVIEYMHKNCLSIRETARKFNIPQHSTVSKWERIYCEEGPAALSQECRGRCKSMNSKKQIKLKQVNEQTKEDLIAEVQRLRMENDYLKKLNALIQEKIVRENGK